MSITKGMHLWIDVKICYMENVKTCNRNNSYQNNVRFPIMLQLLERLVIFLFHILFHLL